MNNKKYWLKIEPYIIMVIKKKKVLFYNTLSGEKFEYQIKNSLQKIIRDLDNKENLRVIELADIDLINRDVKEFITTIRNLFIGDIIDASLSECRPVQFTPLLNNQRDIKKLQKDGIEINQDLKKYLSEITIYLNGDCKLTCNFCDKANNQFFCCTKNNFGELEFEIIENIFKQIAGTNISYINFIGGNLLNYSKLFKIPSLLEKYKIKGDFYMYYENFITDYLKFPIIPSNLYEIRIIIPSQPSNQKKDELFNIIKSSKLNASLVFILESNADFEINEQVESLGINYEFYPFYNKSNYSFFEENVFLDHDDIFNKIFSHKDIFRNMSLNSNSFGKLIINNQGSVFGSFKSVPIGNLINNTINEIIYKEFSDGNNWLNTREEKPCIDCLYQYFCPSPSAYEKAIGKINLCSVCK